MSEFIFIILWLAVFGILKVFVPVEKYEIIEGKKSRRVYWFYAIILFAPVIYMTTFRSNMIGDTLAYQNAFKMIPNIWGEVLPYIQNISKDQGFVLLGAIIKNIFGESVIIYFLILALIQGIALIYVYRKYSISYCMSVFLFIVSTDYVSWMYNGVRQFTAVTIIFAATPLMLKKKWLPLIGVILLASTIHGSALLMLPIVFIVQGGAWNKKTLLLTIVCVIAFAFADRFTDVLGTLLEETQYTNVVSDWKGLNDNGTNIIRVIVYSVPAFLAFVGRKHIAVENDNVINLCTNMSIISSALYLVSAGTSGVYIGRLPIYTSLYGYILLPYLIEKMFTRDSAILMRLMMVGAYLLFYYYQMHLAWGLL